MKILVLEDNERLCSLIECSLIDNGYKVDVFYDGEDALEALNNGYQCFVLDINVPSLDGISVLETIRLYHGDIPVIIISSNYELDRVQNSYESGCDDYIKKPFFMYELIQKVKKLCHFEPKLLDLGEGVLFNPVKHFLKKDGEEINLARKEIIFLELLANDLNRVFSYDEIEEYVWEGEITTRINIRSLVKRLRRKIPDNCIKSVKGIGYSFDAEVVTLSD